MISIILADLFLVLAAAFKAVADTVADHFEKSIFKDLNPKWWNKNESWKQVKFIRFTKYRPDAWHLAGSGMIISFVLFAVIHLLFPFQLSGGFWWIVLKIIGLTALYGTVFILVFNLFYNRLLIKRL